MKNLTNLTREQRIERETLRIMGRIKLDKDSIIEQNIEANINDDLHISKDMLKTIEVFYFHVEMETDEEELQDLKSIFKDNMYNMIHEIVESSSLYN